MCVMVPFNAGGISPDTDLAVRATYATKQKAVICLKATY